VRICSDCAKRWRRSRPRVNVTSRPPNWGRAATRPEAEDVEGLVRRSVEEYERTRAASDRAADDQFWFVMRALFSNFLAARQGVARRVEQERLSDNRAGTA
jgi:hypothetical protein